MYLNELQHLSNSLQSQEAHTLTGGPRENIVKAAVKHFGSYLVRTNQKVHNKITGRALHNLLKESYAGSNKVRRAIDIKTIIIEETKYSYL